MTVFGLVVNLPHEAATIVFIVVLILLLFLEGSKIDLAISLLLYCAYRLDSLYPFSLRSP